MKYFKPQIVVGHSFAGIAFSYYFSKMAFIPVEKMVLMGVPNELTDVTNVFFHTINANKKVQAAYYKAFYEKFGYEANYFTFFGYQYMEKPVSHFAISGLKLQVEPWSGKFISFNFNYGYFKNPVYSFINDVGTNTIEASEDFVAGTGIQLGLLTSIGPAVFSSEYNFMTNNFNFYLTLGYSF